MEYRPKTHITMPILALLFFSRVTTERTWKILRLGRYGIGFPYKGIISDPVGKANPSYFD